MTRASGRNYHFFDPSLFCVAGGVPRTRVVEVSRQPEFHAGLLLLSKAAIIHMSYRMAVEWGEHDIGVKTVAPTSICNDGTAPALSRPGFCEDVVERVAVLHGNGKPNEVSGGRLNPANLRWFRTVFD